MKVYRYVFVLLVLLGSLSHSFAQNKFAKAYTQKHKELAERLSVKYGIPTNVILAVAVVESSSGAGRTVKLLNNHFGIVGKNTLKARKLGYSRYKEYTSTEESFEDFCKLITRRKFYGEMKGNPQAELWIQKISKTGYSEVPEEWLRKVSNSLSYL